MLNWAHYQFKEKQLFKAKVHGAKIFILGEEYTTKRCGACGEIKENIKGRKILVSKNWGVRYDRDLGGGARNICLKNISIVSNWQETSCELALL